MKPDEILDDELELKQRKELFNKQMDEGIEFLAEDAAKISAPQKISFPQDFDETRKKAIEFLKGVTSVLEGEDGVNEEELKADGDRFALLRSHKELLEFANFFLEGWGDFLSKTNIAKSFYSGKHISYMNELECKAKTAIKNAKEIV